ncbi:MAG: endonuclease III domain-containing protein [Candidatus Woesearchaeota archaeon]
MITPYGKKVKYPTFVNVLQQAFETYDNIPLITLLQLQGDTPFKILIATILSARTKDQTTAQAVQNLFAVIQTPQQLARLDITTIAQLIYPVGFFQTKAKHIKACAQQLVDTHDGEVPQDIDTLVTLPGVGRKTANLVVAEAFDKHGLCVDTHVHRISNRLGIIRTQTPLQTEMTLRSLLPSTVWKRYTMYLVAHGQKVCTPISPKCSECRIKTYCKQKGVESHR